MSSELFRKRPNVGINNLGGTIGVSDNIIIYGVGETSEETSHDHEMNFIALLKICRFVGIKLNMGKAEIKIM